MVNQFPNIFKRRRDAVFSESFVRWEQSCSKARFQSLVFRCSDVFSVKSFRHLASSSPLDSKLHKNLWKTKCPRRINIIIWVMIFGSLNCSQTLQRKPPNHYLLPSICPVYEEQRRQPAYLLWLSILIWRTLFAMFKSYLQCLTFIGFFEVILRRMCLSS